MTTQLEGERPARMIDRPMGCHTHYVLGGQKMKIVINEEELVDQVLDILRLMPDNKILIDHFLDGAIEAESDSICDGELVRIIGMMEHIEPAGIHSGDSNAVLPSTRRSRVARAKLIPPLAVGVSTGNGQAAGNARPLGTAGRRFLGHAYPPARAAYLCSTLLYHGHRPEETRPHPTADAGVG